MGQGELLSLTPHAQAPGRVVCCSLGLVWVSSINNQRAAMKPASVGQRRSLPSFSACEMLPDGSGELTRRPAAMLQQLSVSMAHAKKLLCLSVLSVSKIREGQRAGARLVSCF